MKHLTVLSTISLLAFMSCKNAEGSNYANSNDELNLALNLEQGKTYKYIIDTESSIKQEYNGQKMDMNMTITGDMSFDVKEKAGDITNMDAIYNSMKFSMITPQGTLGFNSNNQDSTDVFSKIMSTIIGKKLSISMTKNGSISNVKGFNEIFDGMTKAIPELTNDENEQAKMQLEQLYGEESIKSNFKQITGYLPNKKVKVGDKWNVTDTLNQNGLSFINEATYELLKIDKNDVTIKGTTKIYPNPNFNSLANANYTGSGDMEFKINKNTGWIISGTGTQTMKGSMKIDEMQGNAPSEIPLEMKITTKYSGLQQ